MNYSDTERIKTVLEKLGMQELKSEKDSDVIIYNTCSVRQKAEDRVYGEMVNIMRLKKKNKSLLFGLTGCMIRKTSTKKSNERDPLFTRITGLDFVFKIEDLGRLGNVLNELSKKFQPEKNDSKNYFKINPKYTSKFQAYVPISTGCDKFCTYCIVPYSRGREKSRYPDEIFDECKKLVENGCKEITLLGQTVDSYGLSPIDQKTGKFDKKDNLAKLLKKLDTLKKKGLKRIRFTSSHPKDFTETLIKTIAKLETLMPYIHLPVQSGDDAVLKRMNRPYTRAQYLSIIKKIRKYIPDCAISTDIIVGFCGETEKEFKNTYNLYKEVQFDQSYHAQYSPRKGTVSERTMEDNVKSKVKAERWHKLNNLLRKISAKRHKKFIGKEVNVLVEECRKGICIGKNEHSKIVRFKGDKKMIGEIIPVKITRSREWNLIGRSQL